MSKTTCSYTSSFEIAQLKEDGINVDFWWTLSQNRKADTMKRNRRTGKPPKWKLKRLKLLILGGTLT